MLIVEAIRHREKLVARAAKIVGPDAEDVVSDLMIYFMESRMNAPENPLRLLMWYTKNRSIQHLRKRKTEQKAIQNAARLIEDESSTSRDIDELERKMAQLHPMVARLIVMHYAEGMTIPEIERQTGIKKSRIEYLISTGKNQLRNGKKN